MKRKHVIATFALSALMGIGVFAGVRANKVKEAKAATATTVYCAVDVASLKTTYSISDDDFVMKCNVNRKGDGDDWATYTMLDTKSVYDSKTVYSASFTDLYDGLGCIQFQVHDQSKGDKSWQAQDQVFGTKSWTSAATYNGKIHVYGGSGWTTYTPSSYKVNVYVDGNLRGEETVGAGALPVTPTLNFGQRFSGWFNNAEMTEGHEVEAITGATTVYGAVINIPTVTYTLDLTAVSEAFPHPYLHAWNNLKNHEWPGVALTGNTFTVPNDAQIIIANSADGSTTTAQTVDIAQSGIANDTLTVLAAQTEGKYNYVWESEKCTATLSVKFDADVPEYADIYIPGAFNGWSDDVTVSKMARVSDTEFTYALTDIMPGTYGYKIVACYTGATKMDWDHQVTASDQSLEFTAEDDGKTIDLGTKTYDFATNMPAPVEPDVPAEDGYYIVGTESNWKYDGATKMGAGEGTNKAYLRYNAKAGEIFKVRSYLDGVDTWYGENYEVGEEAKVLDIYLNKDNEVYIAPYVEPDVPTEGNGYYIVGSETEWKFKDAQKMSTEGLDEGNCAEIFNYHGKKDESLKVRGYFEGEDPEVKHSFYKGGKVMDGETEIGDADEFENFVFANDAYIDIFAKWEGEPSELHFYVTKHADRYDVTIHDVLFEGAAKVGVAEQTHSARATAGVDFEYNLPDMNGYVARALYTDANCTTLYEKHALTGNTDLYAKYTRLGNYMTGDATYAGSEALAWNIDGASYLTSQVNDPQNRLEGTVVIPASADEEHPVAVKALQFTGIDEEGKTIWAATTYTLGAEYTFVELDKDSNFVFKKGGTFAVYINQENKVYFNEGAAAFYTKFITDMNHVCDADGHTNTEALAAKWLEEKAAYDSLSADEKAAIVAVTIDGGNPEGDDLHKVVAAYKYIVTKYGTTLCEDFIWNGTYAPEANYNTIGMTADDTTMTVVVISAIAVISAAGLFFLIRRKRRLVK